MLKATASSSSAEKCQAIMVVQPSAPVIMKPSPPHQQGRCCTTQHMQECGWCQRQQPGGQAEPALDETDRGHNKQRRSQSLDNGNFVIRCAGGPDGVPGNRSRE
ncbi:hypothetical protein ACFTAO_22405 [Paenibacillus rhizoplanae]